jgi:hypothetical protein
MFINDSKSKFDVSKLIEGLAIKGSKELSKSHPGLLM